MIWSQRIDPKAGEWKHEIIGRGLCAAVAVIPVSLFVEFVYIPHLFRMQNGRFQAADIMLFILIGLVVALSETWLRKTWFRGLFNSFVCIMATIIGFYIASQIEDGHGLRDWAPFVMLGGASGICAGHGARNLLATIVAFVGGQAGALAGIQIILNSPVHQNILTDWISRVLLILLLLVPAALCIGVGVWAGCRFSKTKRLDSPQPPAPSGL